MQMNLVKGGGAPAETDGERDKGHKTPEVE